MDDDIGCHIGTAAYGGFRQGNGGRGGGSGSYRRARMQCNGRRGRSRSCRSRRACSLCNGTTSLELEKDGPRRVHVYKEKGAGGTAAKAETKFHLCKKAHEFPDFDSYGSIDTYARDHMDDNSTIEINRGIRYRELEYCECVRSENFFFLPTHAIGNRELRHIQSAGTSGSTDSGVLG